MYCIKVPPNSKRMKMKKYLCSILIVSQFVVGCSVKKNLEISAPFKLGAPFGQKWVIEANPMKSGYDVIIPILSLDEDDAVLHNLYHQDQMAPVEIEMREIGMVAVARFDTNGKFKTEPDKETFPFQLNETEGVLSYLQKKRVRYIKVNGIQKKPIISYPSLAARHRQ